MPDIVDVYYRAWQLLEKRIAKSRRQSISKSDLTQWQLKAIEQALHEWRTHGEQEET